MKVIIDPGHGGADSGAVGELVEEKTINIEIALKLETELWQLGITPVLTRTTDEFMTLNERVRLANEIGGDYFVSIHCNSHFTPFPSGIEVFYFKSGKGLADNIYDSMCDMFPGNKRRGVKHGNYYVLRETTMPAILIECEFLSNRFQREQLIRPSIQEKYAKAIAVGLLYKTERGAA